MNGVSFNQREMLTGLLYLIFGTVAVAYGQAYGFGSTSEMGPGFFPVILGCILTVIGLITLVRSFMISDDGNPTPLQSIYWKGFILLIGSVLIFAWLLPRVGLVISLPLMLLLSAMASTKFRPDIKSIALLAAFCILCTLLFVRGLGVPMPLFGTYFG